LEAAEEESWACREMGVSSLWPSEEQLLVADVPGWCKPLLRVGVKSLAEVCRVWWSHPGSNSSCLYRRKACFLLSSLLQWKW